MQSVVTVGLDIAKNVFQARGVDAEGEVVFRKRITRAKLRDFFASLPKCLVGIEANASSHHWAREIGALGHREADAASERRKERLPFFWLGPVDQGKGGERVCRGGHRRQCARATHVTRLPSASMMRAPSSL